MTINFDSSGAEIFLSYLRGKLKLDWFWSIPLIKPLPDTRKCLEMAF